ncbi:MAG: hypothetical protein RL758_265 [Pseudomonadota bacterium]|jgi:hypothetical protein
MNDIKPYFAQEDGKVILGTVQDCTPIAERAKRLHNEDCHGSSETKHAMSLPLVMVEKYCNDHGITFREFMTNRSHLKSVLRDPDLSHFRIWKGKV